ncbi:MAG: GNAT family N-acetyltransferase [Terriglobia bacterium]
MATVPLPRVEIVDLRQVRSRQLAPLFDEQQQAWREELHWDYKPSVAIIKKHIDARALPGYVALVEGGVAGYCFFVYEEAAAEAGRQKALIGDLFVREAFRPLAAGGPASARLARNRSDPGLATQLLERALETLADSPGVIRMEAQVMPFGLEPLAPVFLAHTFRSYPRLFMYKDLKEPSATPPGRCLGARRERDDSEDIPPGRSPSTSLRTSPGAHVGKEEWEIEQWEDSYFEPLAALMVSAYAGHVDSQINDQYSTREGALKFLKNIVVFPGCGVFRPEASYVALSEPSGGRATDTGPRVTIHGSRFTYLAGALLLSQVAPRIAHITQVCVRREAQGTGLGRRLLARTLDSLHQKGYEGVSLSVTADNPPAVGLYRRFGFEVLKDFAAYVWQKPSALGIV